MGPRVFFFVRPLKNDATVPGIDLEANYPHKSGYSSESKKRDRQMELAWVSGMGDYGTNPSGGYGAAPTPSTDATALGQHITAAPLDDEEDGFVPPGVQPFRF
jgi:hypothetical protein